MPICKDGFFEVRGRDAGKLLCPHRASPVPPPNAVLGFPGLQKDWLTSGLAGGAQLALWDMSARLGAGC